MSLAEVLPLAIVMVAGPQIISAVFLATSERPGSASAAFLTGAALAVLATVTAWYWIFRSARDSGGGSHQGPARTVIDAVVLVLLLYLAVHVYLGRHTSTTPRWMTGLRTAGPRRAFTLGFLLFLVFPTDLATTGSVGGHLASHGSPWWQCLPFVGLTLLFAGLPALVLLLFGSRARRALPSVRNWMNSHAWVISEIVIVFFLVITASSLVRD